MPLDTNTTTQLPVMEFIHGGNSDHIFAGNYGILDQWLALKCVSENSEGFGGDPTKV